MEGKGAAGFDLVTELANSVANYKGKGDALEQGNYMGLTLLEHVMKVVERIVEGLVREKLNIEDMQFGFMSGRGTTDAISLVRQLQEKYLEKKKRLYSHLLNWRRLLSNVHTMYI